MTRDLGAIVAPALDLDAEERATRKLARDLQEAARFREVADEQAARDEEKAAKSKEAAALRKQEEDQRRLALGRQLAKMRPLYPRSGPKAAAWGRLVSDCGISQDQALDYMRLAGFVEDRERVSRSGNGERETPVRIPTAREIEADRRERKEEARVPEPPAPAISDADRKRIADAERLRAIEAHVAKNGGRIDERQTKAVELLTALVNARDAIKAVRDREIHLTDVSTSPAEFERAKALALDVFNACRDELERVGIVPAASADAKSERRQLRLVGDGE